MNPEKLAQFSKNKLLPDAAQQYQITREEMPKGLKKYMEYNLFPRIQLKVAQGISLCTAHWWLCWEGLQFILHKKGLYFDGHDFPNVTAYRQNVFLPTMKTYEYQLVHYAMGNLDQEVKHPL